VAWGTLGERVAQYLTKGRPALVSGRLQSRSWEQEGQKRSKVEVVANDVTFLGGPGGGSPPVSADEPMSSSGNSSKKSAAKKVKDEDVVIEDIGDEPINLDDIPF
jgi:single-strand DNA-binding protein